MKPTVRVFLIVAEVGVLLGMMFAGNYNSLVGSDQEVQAQWGQIQNVYKRRLDLIPNLVSTVKGAAGFEKSTYIAVTEARSKAQGALQTVGANPGSEATKLAQVQQTQGKCRRGAVG